MGLDSLAGLGREGGIVRDIDGDAEEYSCHGLNLLNRFGPAPRGVRAPGRASSPPPASLRVPPTWRFELVVVEVLPEIGRDHNRNDLHPNADVVTISVLLGPRRSAAMPQLEDVTVSLVR